MSFGALEMGFETGHDRWGLRRSWPTWVWPRSHRLWFFFFFSLSLSLSLSYLVWLFSHSFFCIFLKLMMCHIVIGCCKMIGLHNDLIVGALFK
jgi:hypothetical protein